MKVLLVNEASGVHRNLRKGLLANGIEATLFLSSRNKAWRDADDAFTPDWPGVAGGLARNFAPFVKLSMLPRYDVINLINTITAVPGTKTRYHDVPLLRKKADVLAYYALGCDEIGIVRRNVELPYRPCETCLSSGEQLGKDCERFLNPRYERSREIVSNNFDFGASSMQEYSHCSDLFPLFRGIRFPVDMEFIPFNPAKPRAKTRIIHTPSRRGYKGTSCVLEAIRFLNAKRKDFEFEIIDGLPYRDYLNAVSEADVVIDQVYSQSAGMNALEMLAAGKVVLTGATDLGNNFFRDGFISPTFDASPHPAVLAHTLSEVLDLRTSYGDLAERGRQFVIDAHDPRKIAAEFVENWRKVAH